MARLPDLTSRRPVARPTRAVASVDPRAMAAGGNALEDVGDQVRRFGDVLIDREATAVATERDTYVADQLRELLYNPETGFIATQGRNSVDARARTLEEIERLRTTATQDLGGLAKRKLQSSLDRRLEGAMSTVEHHTLTQRDSWLAGASQARVASAVQDSLVNPAGTDAAIKLIENEVRAQGMREGWGSERTNLELEAKRSGVYTAQVERIAASDPIAAMEYMRDNQDRMLPSDVVNIEAKLQPEVKRAVGRARGKAAAMGALPLSGVVEAGSGYTVVRTEDGQTVRRDGTRAWRNNNPGNIEYGDFAKSQGAVGTDGRFAVFPTYEAGRKAKAALIFESSSYRNLTIAAAISRYAPEFENNTSAYTARVVAAAGVSSGTKMSELTATQRVAVLNAMERVEGFRAGQETGGSTYAPQGQDELVAIVDPVEREAALAEYDLVASLIEGKRKAAHDAAVAAAVEMIESGGNVDDLPLDTRIALGMDGMTALRNYQAAKARGEEIETNDELYYDFRLMAANDPAGFRNFRLIEYRDQLSDSDFETLIDLQTAGRDSVTGVAASTLMTTASRQLTAAGFDTTPKAGSKDAKTVAAVQSSLVRWQDKFIAENGRQPTTTEIDERVAMELVPVVIKGPAWMGDNQSGPAAAINYDGDTPLPDDDMSLDEFFDSSVSIRDTEVSETNKILTAQLLEAQLGRLPTPQEVVAYLIEQGLY